MRILHNFPCGRYPNSGGQFIELSCLPTPAPCATVFPRIVQATCDQQVAKWQQLRRPGGPVVPQVIFSKRMLCRSDHSSASFVPSEKNSYFWSISHGLTG